MPIIIIDIRNNHTNIHKSDNTELDSSNDGLTGKERVYTVFHNMSVFQTLHIY